MKNSKIEWCDHTFNPWEGCTKVSPGCANCYAENRNARFGGGTAPNWGFGAPRRRTSADNWKQPLKWDREHDDEMISWAFTDGPKPRRPRVFCASLADWLDAEVPIQWLADMLDVIRRTPNLDWLLLTKRPQNWRKRIELVMDLSGNVELSNWCYAWLGQAGSSTLKEVAPVPPANVWIGTSVEDQARANERVPLLLDIPAVVRFLSMEPLLGLVDLRAGRNVNGFGEGEPWYDALLGRAYDSEGDGTNGPGIHWVIAGGESGPHARPMHPDWARSLRDQCKAAGVPYHFKQWGEWVPGGTDVGGPIVPDCLGARIDDPSCSHYFQDPPHLGRTWRVGKHAAGRLLDGVEHNGFPGGAS